MTPRTLLIAVFLVAFPPGPRSAEGANASEIRGLYRNWERSGIFFWGDGRYTYDAPKARPDGSFDYAATRASLDPDKRYAWGSYRISSRSGNVLAVVLTDAAGDARTVTVMPHGTAPWDKKRYEPVKVPRFREVLGTFRRSHSTLVGGDNLLVAGQNDLQVSVASTDVISFLPGRKFQLAQSSYLGTSSTIGDGSGGGVSSGGSFERERKSTQGRYEIRGFVMVFRFDDGRTEARVLEYRPPEGERTQPRLQLDGQRAHVCEDTCSVR